MSTFIDRLKVEHNELEDRIEKLELFLVQKSNRDMVGSEQLALLEIQLLTMESLLCILKNRLDNLEAQDGIKK